jgi:hypothetical protein
MARISDGNTQLGPYVEGQRYDLPAEDISQFGIRDMQNMRLTVAGAAEKRLGTKSYKSESAISGTPTVTACGQFQIPGGAAPVFIVAGDKFYEYSSGWVDRSGSVSITAGDDNTWEWVRAFDNLVATNGVDTDAFKWSGSGNATVLDDDARFTKAKHLGFWDNRLWVGNVNGITDRVWYSDIGDIETWGATNFYNLGSPVSAIAPQQNGLAIHTEDAIHSLIPTGNSTIPYQLQQRTSSDPQNPQRGGSLSGRAVITLPNDTQMFPLDDGIYAWSGGTDIQKVSHALDLGYWDTLNTSRLHQSFAIYYAKKNEVWFWLPYGTSQTNMSEIMIMSTKLFYQDPVSQQMRNVWYGPFNATTTTFERNCAAIIDNEPHAGTFGGKLLDHAPANTFNDETAAYSSYFETGSPPAVDSGTDARWLYADIYHDSLGEYIVTVQQTAAAIGIINGSFTTTAPGGALGSFTLDTSKLAAVRAQIKQVELLGYDPHTSLKFSNNNADEPFRIRRAHTHYAIIGPHRRAP